MQFKAVIDKFAVVGLKLVCCHLSTRSSHNNFFPTQVRLILSLYFLFVLKRRQVKGF